MYTKKEIDQVLKIYDKLGSVRGTIRALGYPSRNLLRRWVNERKEFGKLTVKTNSRGTDDQQKKKAAQAYLRHGRNLEAAIKVVGHTVTKRTVQRWVQRVYPEARKLVFSPPGRNTRRYSWETKVKAVLAMRRHERSIVSVAREYGVSRPTLYAWNKEVPHTPSDVPETAMTLKHEPPRKAEPPPEETAEHRFERACQRVKDLEKQVTLLAQESEELRKQIRRLQLHKDVLVETMKILKKDEDGNPKSLSNRDKTIVIDVLRKTFKLKDLLEIFGFSKSSYFYHHMAQSRGDKYTQVKKQIHEMFDRSYRR